MNQHTYIENDFRWQCVLARRLPEGQEFVFAVKTTGIYRKPSCTSRHPNRENVVFFDSAEEAEKAGFRPCGRCRSEGKPDKNPHTDAIVRACRIIEASDEPPGLQQLADAVGISSYHFHRIFKSEVGLTPKAYSAQHRLGKFRAELRGSETSVTDAIFAAGFNSSSRFYEKGNNALGMSPVAYRSGGEGTDIQFAVAQCSLGAILVAASRKGVCTIGLGDDPDALVQELQDNFPNATLLGGDEDFEKLVAKVIGFIEHPEIGLNLPLDLRGTAFQHRVWQALMKIPAGKKASYFDIAKSIGSPKAVRAVAQACAANKVAVAVPCHRVVRNDGSLSGYRWGVSRKAKLLEREGNN